MAAMVLACGGFLLCLTFVDTMKKERTGELRKLLAQTGVHSTAV